MAEQADTQLIRDADAERERMIEVIVLIYLSMLVAAQNIATRVLHLNPGDLLLDRAAIRRAVAEGTARGTLIDAMTQQRVAELVSTGRQLGLSGWEIANGDREGVFKGIEGLFETTWNARAEMIARTELQKALLDANTDRFQRAGVKWLRAHDGDHDARCAARNGRIYPINNPPQLLHPRCILTISPATGP